MTDPRTELVGGGFDEIADQYLEWASHIHGDPKLRWVLATT